MARAGRMQSFVLEVNASFRGQFQERDFYANNIIDMLEGSDPDFENIFVIISAHYDHLGIGPAVMMK